MVPFFGCATEANEDPELVRATVTAGPLERASADCGAESNDTPPARLKCTGLYADWEGKRPAPGVREFVPSVKLWSDGAEKKRWILLPPGTQIDTTDMEQWVFPVGTKLWKEFAFAGKPVETRMFWKASRERWLRTTYRWSDDGTDAVHLETGYREAQAVARAPRGYEIPTAGQCDTCHAGSADKVLGFQAVALALPGATGYTLAELVAEGRLTVNPPKTSLEIPEDGHGSRKALGWLHANCGLACHNTFPGASCAFKGMHLRLTYAELAENVLLEKLGAYTTTVGVAASMPEAGYRRIAAGDLDRSAIHFLASHRADAPPYMQMPPIGTHIVDPVGVGYLAQWITGLERRK